MDIIGSKHIIRHIALVYIDMRPLSALRFMTGNGIGKLHLQSIEIRILPDCLHTVCLQWYVLIIFLYLMEKLLLLIMGQSRSLTRQGIQQYRSLQFIIIIIGKFQQKGGKMKAIEFDATTHLHHLRPIAISQESRKFVTLNFFTLNLELGTRNFMIS